MFEFTSLFNDQIKAGLLALLVSVAGVFGTSCVTGCSPNPPFALPQEFATTTDTLGASILSQTIWDHMDGSLAGHAQDPGMEVYFNTEYSAGSRIAGFNGQVNLRGRGTGTGSQNDETQTLIRDIYANSRMTEAEKVAAILALLGVQPDIPDVVSDDSVFD